MTDADDPILADDWTIPVAAGYGHPAPSPTELPQIEGLIDAIEDRHEEDNACPTCTHPSCERRRQRSRDAIAARTALREAYAAQAEHISILRNQLFDRNASIARLQQEALTADEKAEIVRLIPDHYANDLSESVCEKLGLRRRISGGSLEETEK